MKMGHILGAAIKGEQGELYYFTVEDGEPDDKTSIREAFLYRINYDGEILKKS